MLVQIRGIPLALLFLAPWPHSARAASPPAYQIGTIAGSDLVGDSGPALAAQMSQPEGLAIDSAGNLYIADAANHRVRKVSPNGNIATIAGNGHPGFSGDNGPSTAAQLNQPYGLALDSSGNLYIADLGNQRVRRIGTDGTITTVAGNGQTGASGDGGAATSAPMLSPRNVAIDSAGNLYISEFAGHAVRRVTPTGTISTVAGTGIAGYGGDGGPAIAAQLAFPAGIALDPAGSLYIADTANQCIRKVQSGVITTICNRQTFGEPYLSLSGLASDSSGHIYIPESINAYVWQWSANGTLTRVAGAPGSNVSSADGAPATLTALRTPVDVTIDASGDIYISETAKVRVVSAATGILVTVAGTGTFGFSGDGGSASAATLTAPTGLTYDTSGNLYIADSGNQRVRMVTPAGVISTIAGNGIAGYQGDGMAALSASLYAPYALAFDSAANLYIADSANNRVRQIATSGVIATFAGDGLTDGYGADGDAASTIPLFRPQGVVVDASGNVDIADTDHHRILQVVPAGNANTIAGTGTGGFDGDGSTATLAELNGPAGLALDNSGNLYIADSLNNRVRMLTPAGAISTVAGNGAGGFGGDGAPATAAQLSSPCAVAVDSSGDIFIADSGNNRIRMVTPDGNINTIAGTGDNAYNGDTGLALQVALFNPCGLALDGKGDVLVADTANNRVRMLSVTNSTPPPPSIGIANSASLQAGPLAPGEIFSIFGTGLGPAIAADGTFDANDMLPVLLGGTQVLFNGIAAPLFYVQTQQINAQVPFEMSGLTTAQLQVVYQGSTVVNMPVSLVDANPALFSWNSAGVQAIAVNQDGSLNSDRNPAAQGSIVVLYATGYGQTSPVGVTGQGAQAPFGLPLLQASITIANATATVLWAGSAPGFVGLMQINVQIPSGLTSGDLPVVLSIGTYQSPAGVTIAVQ